jgi:hypothetical protein
MACRIKQQRRRACLTTRPVLSQAGGFDPVDAEAAALITASARHWTSRATCLSDSRSLSARLPSRKTRRNTPCPSFTPAPAATAQPPAPSRPIRGQRSDIRLSVVFAPPADGRVDDRDHVPQGHRCALTRQVAGLILEPVHRHFASSISDARFTRFSDDMNSTVIAEGLSSTDLRTPHHDRTAATPESRKSLIRYN